MEITPIKQNVTCKNCGKLHTLDCYPIINFQSLPQEFVQKVFSLDLFKIKCDCGAETIVQYNTVIVDMYKKYIIYLFVSEDKDIFYNNIKPELIKLFSEKEEYKQVFESLNNTRLVCSINDLLEKLLIFDYDLNDEIIECIKLTLLKDQQFKDKKINKIFFDKIEKSNLIFTLLCDSEKEEEKQLTIGIDIEYYNNVLEKYKEYSKNINKQAFELIDINYIINVLQAIEK